MKAEMKLAVCQMHVTEDKYQNVENAVKMLKDAACKWCGPVRRY